MFRQVEKYLWNKGCWQRSKQGTASPGAGQHPYGLKLTHLFVSLVRSISESDFKHARFARKWLAWPPSSSLGFRDE